MRILLFVLAVAPVPVFAHVGHLGELASHDHWIAGAAIGAAAAIALWGALKGKKENDADDEHLEEEEA